MQALATTKIADELSLDAWANLPEDEPGELVDGVLAEEEMPSYVHEILVALLIHAFSGWTLPRGGLVAGSDAKFAVSPHRGRKPDVTVYLPGSPLPPPRGAIGVPPDIAVEIASATPQDGRRDRVEKVADYAAFGIRFYWLLDPQLRSLEILELGPGGYVHVLGVTDGVVEGIPGCEGLTIDLDALWATVDRLEAQESPDD